MTIASPSYARPLATTDRWPEWDAFVRSIPSTGFMQSSWWADFRALSEYEHFGIVLRSGSDIVGGALVLKFCYADEQCFYYIPEGPVLSNDEEIASEVFEALLEAIEEHRLADADTVSHLRIEPRWLSLPAFVSGFQANATLSDRFMEPRDTLCIDLRPSEADILAQMKPKGRYNIRVAERHGVTIVEDRSERGLEDFLTIYEDTADRQEFGAKPPDYFESLVTALTTNGHGTLMFAEYEGVRVAAALVVGFGRRATYFFGGSLATYRPIMAPYLLHFEIMRRARAAGHEWYDLWGIAPAGVPNHRLEGITEFKRKFGGTEVRLVPTLDRIYDPAAYADYLATVRA